MTEINPNNQEGPRPLTPEEIEVLRQRQEAQEGADQMLREMEKHQIQEPGVKFDNGPSEHLVEEAAKILDHRNKASKEIPESAEDGLPTGELEKIQRDPTGWIVDVISNNKLGANDAMLGLIEAKEQEDKKKTT